MNRTIAPASLLALLLIGVASPAMAASSHQDVPDPNGHVVINGKVYGPEQGLTIESGTFALRRAAAGSGSVSPMSVPTEFGVYWGYSYVRTYEQQQLRYTGTAFAKGDVYAGQRTIEDCFRYTRGGSTLSYHCADAVYSGGAWQSGIAQATVWDSLVPGVANQTQFSYSRYAVDPNIN